MLGAAAFASLKGKKKAPASDIAERKGSPALS